MSDATELAEAPLGPQRLTTSNRYGAIVLEIASEYMPVSRLPRVRELPDDLTFSLGTAEEVALLTEHLPTQVLCGIEDRPPLCALALHKTGNSVRSGCWRSTSSRARLRTCLPTCGTLWRRLPRTICGLCVAWETWCGGACLHRRLRRARSPAADAAGTPARM